MRFSNRIYFVPVLTEICRFRAAAFGLVFVRKCATENCSTRI
jgi:hypothetical protein